MRLVTITLACTSAALLGLVALAPAGAAAGSDPRPIPNGRGYDRAVKFIGKVAKPQPVTLPAVPTNPYMSPNGTSNIHNDTYMTDAYRWSGPIGRDTKVTSGVAGGECASIAFDSRGRLVAVCIAGSVASKLTLIHPDTLKVLARLTLPTPEVTNPAVTTRDYTEFAGSYFYLDHRDRAVVAAATHHIMMYAVRGPAGDRRFVEVKDLDISMAMDDSDSVQSALPDFSGRIWFATKAGVVGNVDPQTGVVRHIVIDGEQIANSFAMDEDGSIYIVSTAALYRFDTEADGTPRVTWREEYENDGILKPGQKSIGSGTTPTLMSGNRVAIVDNADPENVVVFRTDDVVLGDRQICTEPVFTEGASATENSLIAVGDALIVENNYGNSLDATVGGASTTPGMARVDVGESGCETVWVNNTVRAPSVVPKFSAKTGLIYTYTKPIGPGTIDRWYWSALDFRTGREVYSVLAGTGILFNNNYAAAYLSAKGVGYVGVVGGVVRIEG